MKRIRLGFLLPAVICLLSSCEENIAVETVVHEDGSLDRIIRFEDVDSTLVASNIFGVSRETGWEVDMEVWERSGDKDSRTIQFKKHFPDVETSNRELGTDSDTLFTLRSEFGKKFKWFYTYIRYTDTYGTLNRFKGVDPADYFTAEDYAFIDRLPAEGKMISRADSLYLQLLNTKIFEHYATRAIFEENYQVLAMLMSSIEMDDRWLDTLAHHKEMMYQSLRDENGDFDDDFILAFADSLSIPLPYPAAREDFRLMRGDFDKRLDFMTDAANAKFSHTIEMPWPVISSNADSIAGRLLVWNPPVVKFMIKDYTMYAESRRINYWALLVSLLLVLVTATVFARRIFRRQGY